MIRAKTATLLGAITLCATMSGCVYVHADGENFDMNDWDHGGAIYGSQVSANNTSTITSASNGCTSKEDYAVDVDRDDGEYGLEFDGINEDVCRAFVRDGVELTWTFQELGIPPGSRVAIEHFSRR